MLSISFLCKGGVKIDYQIIRIINRFNNAKIPIQITVENDKITVDVMLETIIHRLKGDNLLEVLSKAEKDVFE